MNLPDDPVEAAAKLSAQIEELVKRSKHLRAESDELMRRAEELRNKRDSEDIP